MVNVEHVTEFAANVTANLLVVRGDELKVAGTIPSTSGGNVGKGDHAGGSSDQLGRPCRFWGLIVLPRHQLLRRHVEGGGDGANR